MRTIFYMIIAMMTITSCKSIESMVEKGQYDKALTYAVDKLAGEKNKKTKYVKALEKAYAELNNRDYDAIAALSKSNHIDRFEKMHNIYVGLEKRQAVVRPLLPLISEDGYVAILTIENYTEKKTTASLNAADIYYSKAATLLTDADRYNDKSKARDAYWYFGKIAKFDNNYKDTEALMVKAKNLGVVHVAIDVKNESSNNLHYMVANKVNRLRLSSMNNTWEQYYFLEKGKAYDKYIVIKLETIDMGLEKEQVNNYELAALIEDGLEYVYDEKGNIRKDSLGHKITVPRKIITKAWVSEIFRKKESSVSALVLLYNEAKSLPVENIPLTVHHKFEDSAIRFTGDRRALSVELCNRLDNNIADFPSNTDAVDILSNYMLDAIENAIRRLKVA